LQLLADPPLGSPTLAAAGIRAFAWYGLTSRSAAHELFQEVTTAAPSARARCAELRVGGRRANAAGIGSGCGVLFVAADEAPARLFAVLLASENPPVLRR
jgi:hypothetical protein